MTYIDTIDLPTEYNECLCLVDYLELKGIKYSHIHHELYTTSRKQKFKMKVLGVKSGLPDYILIIGTKLVFIEMKRVKGGTVSKTQKEWIEAIRQTSNAEAYVCRGFEEARELIETLLALQKGKIPPNTKKVIKKYYSKDARITIDILTNKK